MDGLLAALADIEGPGCINQFFITSDAKEYRALVLRFYWDDEATPSVEVPLGDFFAMGHDSAPHTVCSVPVSVSPHRGCACYWQMPFRRRARMTLHNEAATAANVVAYRVLYKLHDVPEAAGYFHAHWRRSRTDHDRPEHVILDGVRGIGLFVGTYLAWTATSAGWWGEGEVKFYIDGDAEFPTMADNGTEDYFGGAWCFREGGVERAFSYPFNGLPLAMSAGTNDGPRKFSLYRWHVLDSIGFAKDLRVTVQALGWGPDRKFRPLSDDIASVAYWYQAEPHETFPVFPPLEQRCAR